MDADLMGLARTKVDRVSDEELIRREFERHFSRKGVEIKEYNQVSIRVRITHKMFKGLEWDECGSKVHGIIKNLPPTVQAKILMLILQAPGEDSNPLLNWEFDHPSPDTL